MTLTFCKEMKRKSLGLRYGRTMRKDGKERERYGVCIALAFGLRIIGRKVYKDTSEQNEDDEEQSSRHYGH